MICMTFGQLKSSHIRQNGEHDIGFSANPVSEPRKSHLACAGSGPLLLIRADSGAGARRELRVALRRMR